MALLFSCTEDAGTKHFYIVIYEEKIISHQFWGVAIFSVHTI